MNIHIALKSGTEQHHRQIEKNPLLKKILSHDLNQNQYTKVLTKFFGFIEPLEQKIRFVNSDLAPYLSKSEWLKSDLYNLKAFSDNKKSSHSDTIQNPAQAFGALYVLEGSMLGGQMILKHLKNFDFVNAETSHYYSGYRDKTGENWKNFLMLLQKFDEQNPRERDAIVDSASKTFKALDDWFLE